MRCTAAYCTLPARCTAACTLYAAHCTLCAPLRRTVDASAAHSYQKLCHAAAVARTWFSSLGLACTRWYQSVVALNTSECGLNALFSHQMALMTSAGLGWTRCSRTSTCWLGSSRQPKRRCAPLDPTASRNGGPSSALHSLHAPLLVRTATTTRCSSSSFSISSSVLHSLHTPHSVVLPHTSDAYVPAGSRHQRDASV